MRLQLDERALDLSTTISAQIYVQIQSRPLMLSTSAMKRARDGDDEALPKNWDPQIPKVVSYRGYLQSQNRLGRG
jgi:hypothetical protein